MEKPTTSAPHPAKQRSTRTQQNTLAILPDILIIAVAAAVKPPIALLHRNLEAFLLYF